MARIHRFWESIKTAFIMNCEMARRSPAWLCLAWEGRGMARPRSDPFNVLAIRSAIKRGETTERAAYLDYASTAARPYARSTFALMLKREEPDREDGEALTCADVLDRWRERSPVKPKILALSPGGGLRVQAGALKVFDGGLTPLAIVLSSAGGYVSMEAVRFCARANVAIVALDRSHVFLTLIGGSMQANAATLRAQVCVEPLPIARMIVAAKIESMARVGALGECGRFVTALRRAENLDQVRLIEAQASRIAWPHAPTLNWKRGPIPADWRKPWLMRSRLDAKGKRGARHPVNAMLNAAFAVTAGRLAAYLAATGLDPAIGFLHADKRGRWSLAWDAIEPLRPMIEARLFRFVAQERFERDDFVAIPDGSLRLSPGLLSAVLNHCAPPHAMMVQCVRWLARLTTGDGVADEAADGLREPDKVGPPVGLSLFQRGDPGVLRVGSRRQRG
jgi:CRISPR-associated protein Cas1